MAIARFYCDTDFSVRDAFELPESVAHHIRVRRLRAGDELTLFDGQGNQAQARLVQASKSGCQAQIEASKAISLELLGQITLVQGMASQDKMDWIIEKATELGVTRMLVVQAQRSVVRLSEQRAQRRLAHSQRIIESASEQCGRNHLMQLLMPLSLDEAILQCGDRPMLACLPNAQTRPLNNETLLEPIRKQRGCTIFIGPEGGWDPSEEKKLISAGAMGTSLGARILRTETAGLAAIAALTALLDWEPPSHN